jgi:hypothetical protein
MGEGDQDGLGQLVSCGGFGLLAFTVDPLPLAVVALSGMKLLALDARYELHITVSGRTFDFGLFHGRG